jgi:hypothetical protein
MEGGRQGEDRSENDNENDCFFLLDLLRTSGSAP